MADYERIRSVDQFESQMSGFNRGTTAKREARTEEEREGLSSPNEAKLGHGSQQTQGAGN
jgi:hypothetical protein